MLRHCNPAVSFKKVHSIEITHHCTTGKKSNSKLPSRLSFLKCANLNLNQAATCEFWEARHTYEYVYYPYLYAISHDSDTVHEEAKNSELK